jgi:hypothetical protein
MLAYFIDKETLTTKDVVKLSKYTLDIDEEVNKKSSLTVYKKLNVLAEDYVVLKNKADIEYYGIISDIQNDNGHSIHKINLLQLSNIFNRKILLANENMITTVGIEDFIKYTIESEFSNSSDDFLNMSYIEVDVLSHTPIVKAVDNEEGIYNFHTFITNAKQNYDINITYRFEDGKLKLSVYKDTYDTQIIDTSFSDVSEYSEVREVKYISKVTVKAKDTGLISSWYLQADRTVTTDQNSPTRVYGTTELLIANTEAEMQQVAFDAFKGNSYSHLVEFKLKKESKLIEVEKLTTGTPIILKTKSGGVFDSYISGKVIDSESSAVYFKCGNLRVTLTDKLKRGVL